ncbi:MAG: uracil-DNA glycosylase [Clostridiales bacterium]|nr:uracil-DNA glycosylase [Clostridiales bacterium]
MPVQLQNDWDEIIKDEFQRDYYLRLREFLKEEYRKKRIFPGMHDIFNALKYTPYREVKAVILGQDPYHEVGQAHGLAFSVKPGVAIPPSLLNIFKELQDELGLFIPDNGCLEKWTKQGVLLLNASLTVCAHQANSHKGKGWEIFTDKVISLLNESETPKVFMLWGQNARAKKVLLTSPRHLVLEAAHPSPLSAHAGFFGCGHFAAANRFLSERGLTPIDWQIENV